MEKVSKFVPVSSYVQGNRPSGGGSTIRQMLLSIPRVKWLERPGGPPTDFYHQFKPPEPSTSVALPGRSQGWCEEMKVQPLTAQELTIERLLNDGKTTKQVAEAVGIKQNSVYKALTRIRVKRAHLALQGAGEGSEGEGEDE